MTFKETIQKFFKGVVNVVKAIIQSIQNYMKGQWKEWDRQAEEEEKRGKEQQQVQKEKDLYDRYEEQIWGDKKSKKKR